MRAPEGTLISYATQPGSVAQDGRDGNSPYPVAGDDGQTGGSGYPPDFQSSGSHRKAGDRRGAATLGVSSPIDGTFYFVAPAAAASPPQIALGPSAIAPSPQASLADTLRPDPDFVPIKDAALLRELSERLYEHNFDPEQADGKTGMKLAIVKFQEKSNMKPSGEATEGVLTRLRKLDDLKPWGSIVYGPDGDKGAISWNHASRRAAVDDARKNCGASKMCGGTKLLRQPLRRVCDFRRVLVADSARNDSAGEAGPA